jgi:hypothetical protein
VSIASVSPRPLPRSSRWARKASMSPTLMSERGLTLPKERRRRLQVPLHAVDPARACLPGAPACGRGVRGPARRASRGDGAARPPRGGPRRTPHPRPPRPGGPVSPPAAAWRSARGAHIVNFPLEIFLAVNGGRAVGARSILPRPGGVQGRLCLGDCPNAPEGSERHWQCGELHPGGRPRALRAQFEAHLTLSRCHTTTWNLNAPATMAWGGVCGRP